MFYVYNWCLENDRVTAYGTTEDGRPHVVVQPLSSFILLRGEKGTLHPSSTTGTLPHPFILETTGEKIPQNQLHVLHNDDRRISASALAEIARSPEKWKYEASYLGDYDSLHRHFIRREIPQYCGWYDETDLTSVRETDRAPVFTVLTYDIECATGEGNGFPYELNARDRVYSVACVKSRMQGENQYTILEKRVFLVTEGNPEMEGQEFNKEKISNDEDTKTEDKKVMIHCFLHEKVMLKALIEYFSLQDVQFLLGFHNSGFDDKFLAGRYFHYGLEKDVYRFDYSVSDDRPLVLRYAPGQLNLDVYKFIKAHHKFPRYSLDYLTKQVLPPEETKLPMDYVQMNHVLQNIGTAKRREIDKIVEYNLQDSLATFLLFCKFKVLSFLLAISGQCYINAERLVLGGTTELLKGFICIFGYRHGYILKCKKFRREEQQQKYEGAVVYLAEKGIYEGVAVLDFLSLYPSIIRAFNISPSTCREVVLAGEEEAVHASEEPTGDDEKSKSSESENEKTVESNTESWKKKFMEPSERTDLPVNSIFLEPNRYSVTQTSKEKVGLFPLICTTLLRRREEIKTKLKTEKLSENEERHYQSLQLTVKIIANSCYGQMGSTFSPFYHRVAAETVTARARQLILKSKQFVEDAGFTTAYLDTDSLFFKCTEEEGEEMAAKITEHLNIPGLIMQYENYFTKLFMFSKKKYYGALKGTGFKISGMELNRRDFPLHCKNVLSEIMTSLFSDMFLSSSCIDYAKKLFDFNLSFQYELFSKYMNVKPIYLYKPNCHAPHVNYLRRTETRLTSRTQAPFVTLNLTYVAKQKVQGFNLFMADHIDPKYRGVLPVDLLESTKSACVLFDNIYTIAADHPKFDHFQIIRENLQKYSLVVCELKAIFAGCIVTFENKIMLNLPDIAIKKAKKRRYPTIEQYLNKTTTKKLT